MELNRMYDKRELSILMEIDKENYLIKKNISKLKTKKLFIDAFSKLNDLREQLYCLRLRLR